MEDETMDRLKQEERDLRAQNDQLRNENRGFKKENKGLQEKNEDIAVRISRQRAALTKVEGKAHVLEAERRRKQSSYDKWNREIADREEAMETTQKESDEAVAKLEETKAAVERKQATLKSDRIQLNKERDEFTKKENALEVTRNELEVEKDQAERVTEAKREALKKAEAKREAMAKTLNEVKEIKERFTAKKDEAAKLGQETIDLNRGIKDRQKKLDALIEDAEKEKKTVAALKDKVRLQREGLGRENNALDTRKKEIEKLDLQVKKLIRDNDLGKDVANLKKELGE